LIFVTVGTHTQGFERLIKAVDELAKKNKEKFIIQTGNTKYLPKNCEHFKFVSDSEFKKLCKKSRLIITHGGVGSIMAALSLGKPAIVAPRLKKYNEHLDDHQLDIAHELEKQGRIIALYDVNRLEKAIKKAEKFKPKKFKETRKIPKIIESFISNLEREL